MKEILTNYNINERTLALLPANQIEYETIVIESNKQLYIRKAPFQIIKTACLDNCSTYEGRTAAVKHHTGFKRKTPLPINPATNLYAFPTHSTTDYDCSWIFYNHVLHIQKNQVMRSPIKSSIITFKNGLQIPIHSATRNLETQMIRTYECISKFSREHNNAFYANDFVTTN